MSTREPQNTFHNVSHQKRLSVAFLLSIILIEYEFSTIRQLYINTNDLIHFLFHAPSPPVQRGSRNENEKFRVCECVALI